MVTVHGISSTATDQQPKNDSVSPVPAKKKSSFFRRVFLKQPVRQCFHPGAGNFGADTMQGKFRKGEKKDEVTTGEIIKAGFVFGHAHAQHTQTQLILYLEPTTFCMHI